MFGVSAQEGIETLKAVAKQMNTPTYRVTAFPVKPVREITDMGGNRNVEFVNPLEIAHEDQHLLVLFVGEYGDIHSDFYPELVIGSDVLPALDALGWYFSPKFTPADKVNPYTVIAGLVREWGSILVTVTEVETV